MDGAFLNVPGAAVQKIVSDGPGHPDVERLLAAPDDLWDRIRGGFGLPQLATPEVAAQEGWYAGRPELLRGMFSRARRYLYFIVEEVERRGLPTELALLPLVESGFDPMAVSHARAAGLWQFIPATAARYGIHDGQRVDERHDVIASTAAALDYLQFLYALYNDWQLALASYNWGEQSVSRAIEISRARGGRGDVRSLVLPKETRDYLLRMQAFKNLVEEPRRFGIELDPLPNTPYFAAVEVNGRLTLAAAAQMAEVSRDELRALNPAWEDARLGSRRLLLPEDSVARFRARYGALKSKRPGG